MKDLIRNIAYALVDNPAKVKVEVVGGCHASILELTVAKEDLGKVIGKQGSNVQAMRTILNAASTRIKKRMVLEIIE